MNANQLRIPKTLHFADEISHLNSNFISVNSYNQTLRQRQRQLQH